MTSWLLSSSPDQVVQVRALAVDIALCSWTRHFTLTVPLSTPVYKMGSGELDAGGNPTMDQHPIQGGVEILLLVSCYRTWDKRRPGRPLSLYANMTFTLRVSISNHWTTAPLHQRMFIFLLFTAVPRRTSH